MSEENITNNNNLGIINRDFGLDLKNMDLIANNNIQTVELNNSQEATNQLKMFLIAQAKNELTRIVKLVSYLNIIEDRFISVSEDLMKEYPDNVTIISETMKVLMNCITRSNELISQVIANDKLNSFTIPSIETEDLGEGLSLESRNKIRDLANLVMNKLDSVTEDSQE